MRTKVLVVLVGLAMLIFGSALNAVNSISFADGISQAGYYADEPNVPMEPNEPTDPNEPNIAIPE
ncbi:MAG: hypothetical protein WCE45_07250 [Sedimentisphaerales bacterium]